MPERSTPIISNFPLMNLYEFELFQNQSLSIPTSRLATWFSKFIIIPVISCHHTFIQLLLEPIIFHPEYRTLDSAVCRRYFKILPVLKASPHCFLRPQISRDLLQTWTQNQVSLNKRDFDGSWQRRKRILPCSRGSMVYNGLRTIMDGNIPCWK